MTDLTRMTVDEKVAYRGGIRYLLELIKDKHEPYVGFDDSLWCDCGWTEGNIPWWVHIEKEVFPILGDL